ncbi:aromatic ring-hydroxylating dioxygenase subunit alpha [Polymorphobacter megasporae]|uniref:aromatic ring-hydroxylating dioxygenase subunit alpha n=1 Tax=Glacieibacterium megasporae TaxID=2835787 RepID=UPI001C1E135B|nr:aromatic ring-hydroxylating dioxygenase subunit alpha [Polymorphobacter megasporae]UAJ12598.1 aromatic ring-hydroxylating dioxygenase subunit alpha [Polymorphobacter megasporae]
MDATQNELLTRVGPGTPMGEVLRRYWFPVAGVSEFATDRIKAIRLLGEDLVLYRDLSGAFGLVERQCAHRRADLSYGFVEKCGLRCSYHGWTYDETGQCVAMPFEDTVVPQAKYKDKIRITAYPVRAHAGLLWTYMGPSPAPELPDWEPFNWSNGFRQIVISELPCNWLQAQENSIDPVHFEWMHMNWGRRQEDVEAELGPKHMQIAFDEFEFGLIYRRMREDLMEKHSMWTVGRVCLWPNAFYLGDHFEWRIPIDDENMLSIGWMFNRVPNEQEPFDQASIPTWRGPIADPATGRWYSKHVMNQDFVAWVGQGKIADRTKEKLGLSDRGIQMLRKQLLDDVAAIARGDDPKGIIRDPAKATNVALPTAERDLLVNGASREVFISHPFFGHHMHEFLFQAGQPREVWEDFCTAMGIDPDLPAPAQPVTARFGAVLEPEKVA